MIRTLVADLRDHVGQTVTVAGWAQARRLQRAMQFVLVRDHTGVVQVTHKRDDGPLERLLEQITPESAVTVTGTVIANPVVALGGLEIVPHAAEVANPAAVPLPVDARTSAEKLLDWRHLDLRADPRKRLVFAVQTTAEQAMREFAYAHGCTEMHTPKLMGSPSESGAEVFELGYFGRPAFLAQSPQFYKQMAIAAGIDRVFEIGPAFRAEQSFTSRHATEFVSVDAELAWIDGLEDVLSFQEQLITHVLGRVAERGDVAVTVPSVPFPRITMAQAHRVLREQGWDANRDDLDRDGERRLGECIRARAGHEFVFLTHFPAAARPFYHMRDEQGVTLSADLLWNGLEITTGAQREHRYDVLLAQAAGEGLRTEPMRDYLNCFRYGCPPHGGFALGLGRLLMLLLGLDSIRDATFLFRGPNRLTP